LPLSEAALAAYIYIEEQGDYVSFRTTTRDCPYVTSFQRMKLQAAQLLRYYTATHPFFNFLSTGIRVGTVLAPVRAALPLCNYQSKEKSAGTVGVAVLATMLLCNMIV